MLRTIVLAAVTVTASVMASTATGHAPTKHQHVPAQSPQPAPSEPLSASAARGQAFAQQHCAACHATTANRASPNPESPPFDDIANRPGLTAATLRTFLQDSHNYPAAMNFRIDASGIDDLADYVATLKKPDYRPVM